MYKIQIKLLLLISCFMMLLSCSKNGTVKSSKVTNRTEQINKVDPNSPEMKNVELGVGYLKRGKEKDLDYALEKFKKALAYNPKFALAHSMLANVYDRKGLFDNAETHYKKSIKFNNGNPNIINNYANFLCQRGKYQKAIKKYLEIINTSQYKSPEYAYENAGVCARRDGKIEQAEGFFRKALAINSKQLNSLFYMMQIYIERGNYMKSRAFLQRLEGLIQPSAEILAAGYKIEKGLNHNDLANTYLIKLQSRFPNSKVLKGIN